VAAGAPVSQAHNCFYCAALYSNSDCAPIISRCVAVQDGGRLKAKAARRAIKDASTAGPFMPAVYPPAVGQCSIYRAYGATYGVRGIRSYAVVGCGVCAAGTRCRAQRAGTARGPVERAALSRLRAAVTHLISGSYLISHTMTD
jgi:hypothetical protein